MKKSLKSIVRAISPFARKKDVVEEDTTPDYTQFSWDLEATDLKQALKAFYKKFNPEKAYIVNEILFKYENEETLLLQQLCERYNLTQEDMQAYLDQAPLLGGSKTNTQSAARRPSVSSNGSHSNPNNAEETGKKLLNKKTPAPAAAASKEKKTTSKSDQQPAWDLTDVDMGVALKALYRDYNPTKTPNLQAVQNRSEEDIIIALKQLCKRHGLNDQDMQEYLDRGKKSKSSRNNKNNNAGGMLDDLDGGGSRVPSPTPSFASYDGIPPANPFPKPGTPPPTQLPPPSFNSRSSLLQPAYAPPPPPRPSHSAPPLPPPFSYGSKGGFQQPKDVDGVEEEGGEGGENHEDGGVDGGSKKNIKPTYYLPGGKRFTLGPVLSEMQSNPHISAKVNMSLQQANEEVERLVTENEKLHADLEESRKVQEEMQQKLKDHQLAARRRESTLKQMESLQVTKARQRLDEVIEDNKRLKDEFKDLKDQYDSILDLYQNKTDELDVTHKKHVFLQKTHKKLGQDKKDLLQLINILASAPMAAKNVLESYINKLHSAHPRDEFLLDKVVKGGVAGGVGQMGERVEALLQWKRKQEEDGEEGGDDGTDGSIAVAGNTQRGAQGVTAPSPRGGVGRNDGAKGSQIHLDDLEDDGGGESEDERDLPTDDEDEGGDGDKGLVLRYADHSDDERDDPRTLHLKALSPAERRVYENLRVHKEDMKDAANKRSHGSASPAARATSNPKSNSNLPQSFLTRSVSLPSVTSSVGEGESPDDHPHYPHPNSTEEVLADQYNLVKKFYEHQKSQQKISEKIKQANLSLQEQITEQEMREVVKRTVSPPRPTSSSRSKPRADASKSTKADTPTPALPTSVLDWVECLDPRSQRRYYYSASLKKSTWVKPPEMGGPVDAPSASSQAVGGAGESTQSSRAKSPQSTRLFRVQDIKETSNPSRSLRDPSPSGPMRNWTTGASTQSHDDNSVSSARSASGGLANARSTSPTPSYANSVGSNSVSKNSVGSKRSVQNQPNVPGEGAWVTAVDAKSNRRYWYNRETKVSTWRKPIELM